MTVAEFFIWVGDLSPWVWVALGVVLITIEIIAPSFIFMWPGLAAIVMAIVVWLMPDLAGEYLIAAFAVLSLVMIAMGRQYFVRFTDREPGNRLNSRSKNLIGRRAKVLSFDNGAGTVEVSGVQWPATWAGGQIANPGYMVVIKQVDGVNLSVENE